MNLFLANANFAIFKMAALIFKMAVKLTIVEYVYKNKSLYLIII